MTSVNVYLMFSGECKQAFDFYKAAFGGDFSSLMTMDQMPEGANRPTLKEQDKKKIMHVSLPIGKDQVLMGSDTINEWTEKLVKGNNFSISVTTDTKEEADRLFKELSADGKVIMPMGDTFWGSYFGQFTDKFGITWMISFDKGENNT